MTKVTINAFLDIRVQLYYQPNTEVNQYSGYIFGVGLKCPCNHLHLQKKFSIILDSVGFSYTCTIKNLGPSQSKHVFFFLSQKQYKKYLNEESVQKEVNYLSCLCWFWSINVNMSVCVALEVKGMGLFSTRNQMSHLCSVYQGTYSRKSSRFYFLLFYT